MSGGAWDQKIGYMEKKTPRTKITVGGPDQTTTRAMTRAMTRSLKKIKFRYN